MDVLRFTYHLVYKRGYEQEKPIDSTEAPVNLMVVSESLDRTVAVMWDYATTTWVFRPEVAVEILYVTPERHRTRPVDRATAERETLRFTSTPLPTEEELTAICRADRQA